MIKNIRILLVLSFLFFICVCYLNQKRSYENIFKNFLRDISFKESVPFGRQGKVITINFFKVGDADYVQLLFIQAYPLETARGYDLLDDKVILYYGYDDETANRYLSLKSDFHTLPSFVDRDFSGGIEYPDEYIYYYKVVCNKEFQRFVPDEEFYEQVYQILLDNGMIIFPPLVLVE